MQREKPTIAWVVERYGLRPRMGFIPCPVHAEDTPSCKLHDTWWICFGCGANGDSIGLIAALTKRPVGDVLRDFADPVPSWRAHRTISTPPRGLTVRRAWRELHAWFFHELARRLDGAPAWLLERAVEHWGEQFDIVKEMLTVEDDPRRAEDGLRALAAECERGLDAEQKTWWSYARGQLELRLEAQQ